MSASPLASAKRLLWQDNLLFETLAAPQLLVFGAGHVGSAVVSIMQSLPWNIDWIDSRELVFTGKPCASNLRTIVTDTPELEIQQAPSNSYVLVMTHNHQIDLAICEQALQRPDLAFCGLIGSATKRRRFLQRLSARGFTKQSLDRLTCPIGIDGVSGKHPAQIAVAVVAQLLQRVDQQQMPGSTDVADIALV